MFSNMKQNKKWNRDARTAQEQVNTTSTGHEDGLDLSVEQTFSCAVGVEWAYPMLMDIF